MAAPAKAQDASNWGGLYAGAFGGFGSGQSAQHDNLPAVAATPTPPTPPPPPPVAGPPVIKPPADGHYGVYGGLGGGLVGYNVVIRQVVVGAEASLSGGTISGASAGCGLAPHACGTSVDLQSDYRLRVGLPLTFSFGQVMPFVAGGLALDRIRAYDSQAGASGSTLRAGTTIGGGIEYRIAPQWGLRLEYLHQGFGGSRLFNAAPGFPEEVWASTNIVRAGVTFTFGAAPLATALSDRMDSSGR